MRPALLLVLVAPLALGGCLAKTAFDVATAPVRIASKGVDLATTSQSEADEARGREIRRREEQLGKLQREYDKQLRDCENGSERACEQARATYARIQQALPSVPADPPR
ncbi:hypothetical protein GRI75_00780 [Altererythrobacter soli]|uniref:Lipoprotein n=1 Tax=Croceibacterium soli TaxID=1739690 RepID=A0A6I4UP29_9SPHN|nr:hypothetical protein [Croceibacterium soli]MXP40176.1 hypothetical protein [Croceibacterium soli]